MVVSICSRHAPQVPRRGSLTTCRYEWPLSNSLFVLLSHSFECSLLQILTASIERYRSSYVSENSGAGRGQINAAPRTLDEILKPFKDAVALLNMDTKYVSLTINFLFIVDLPNDMCPY
jgi:hypothetical protein